MQYFLFQTMMVLTSGISKVAQSKENRLRATKSLTRKRWQCEIQKMYVLSAPIRIVDFKANPFNFHNRCHRSTLVWPEAALAQRWKNYRRAAREKRIGEKKWHTSEFYFHLQIFPFLLFNKNLTQAMCFTRWSGKLHNHPLNYKVHFSWVTPILLKISPVVVFCNYYLNVFVK